MYGPIRSRRTGTTAVAHGEPTCPLRCDHFGTPCRAKHNFLQPYLAMNWRAGSDVNRRYRSQVGIQRARRLPEVLKPMKSGPYSSPSKMNELLNFASGLSIAVAILIALAIGLLRSDKLKNRKQIKTPPTSVGGVHSMPLLKHDEG